MSSDTKPKIVPASDINGHAGSHSTGDARIDMREETYSSSQEDLKRLQNDSILKRIPTGAEATTVLVRIIFENCHLPKIQFHIKSSPFMVQPKKELFHFIYK